MIAFDDYIGRSKTLFEGADNPLVIFFQPESRVKMFYGFSHLTNVGYIWWNYLARWLFGDWYSSPIFLNVGLTFVGGIFIYRLAKLAGFNAVYTRALSGFYLLHWDVLAWSSFPNLKEIMIQVLTMGGWYGVMLVNRSESRYRGIVLTASMFAALFFSRFYIPFFILIAYILHNLIFKRDKSSYLGAFAAVALVIWLLPDYAFNKTLRYLGDPYSIILYFFKFILSPQPWALTQKNFWQFYPSILHLLFLVPCVFGILNLWKNNLMRYFILYLMVLMIFLSIIAFGEQRQRVQVGWIIIWAQFEFITIYNYLMFEHKRKA